MQTRSPGIVTVMRGLPPPVLMMADAAGGTLSRRDLIAMGYSALQIRAWLRAGLLVQTGRGEYRVAGSAHPLRQELATMLWRAGSGSRLAGPLVCHLHGLKGFGARTTDHVAVPPHRRVRGVEFKVVRTPVPEEDQDRVLDLPAVTVARALIGAAPDFAPARIRVAHDDAKWRGLVKPGEFAARAADLGNAYGAAVARRIATNGVMDQESEPERDLYSLFRPGDPVPESQVWICWHGRWHRLDFAYRDVRLDVEYDGQDHDATRERDADRDLALAELAVQTIRVTKAMMRSPEDTRRRILAVYATRTGLGLPPLPADEPPWADGDGRGHLGA